MKPKHLLLCFCCLGLLITNAQRPFITTWYTKNPGVSANNQIIFQGTGTNYSIHWINESNPVDTGNVIATGTDTITVTNPGTYELDVTPGKGTFTAIKGFYYNYDSAKYGDAYKLISVDQWGDIKWSTFNAAFINCINMDVNATDIPDLSEVTDMSFAFERCIDLLGDPTMNNWDVSHVTNMQSLFYVAWSFNQEISNWNVSNVTNMEGMFYAAETFNQAIGNWNVSKVTDMTDLFDKAYAFNQPIGNWNVSNVISMGGMFEEANLFNQPIGNWNVSNVTDMGDMFAGAVKFNQPIDNWNVSNVLYANNMFGGAEAFNQPIGNWDVGKVVDMSYMFADALKFNQPIGNWNVSNVTDMTGMFYIAKSFNQPIGNWNVSNVTNMSSMFENTNSFNQPIGTWHVSNVGYMNLMFQGATAFNQPIGNWDVSFTNGMTNMFAGATAFNQPIGNWNVSYVGNMINMFAGASAFNQPIGKWNVTKIDNMNGMFKDAYAFNQDLSTWNTSHLADMGKMFSGAKNFNQSLAKWSLKTTEAMENMLDSCAMDCNNYSQTLKAWADSASTPSTLALGAVNLMYDSTYAQAAHDSLTIIKHWGIFGDKMGHCSVILPVTLLSFIAVQEGNTAKLDWQVANEINEKGYDVEKSINGINYNTIGFVEAKDYKQTNYAYTDNNLTNGVTYYRIKEVDDDGKYMYSSVRKIQYSKFTWKIRNNPVSNTSVELMLDNTANVSIQIISSTGNIVKTIQNGILPIGNYNIPLNINNVNAGLYLIKLMVDDKIYSSSLIKQ